MLTLAFLFFESFNFGDTFGDLFRFRHHDGIYQSSEINFDKRFFSKQIQKKFTSLFLLFSLFVVSYHFVQNNHQKKIKNKNKKNNFSKLFF